MTFVVLLASAVISFVTILSTEQLQRSYFSLTGAAVSQGSGETNLTINAITSLSNQNALITFGSGRVNASCDYCIMDSNNINLSMYSNGSSLSENGRCCVGFTPGGIGFLLENTGNTNVSVGYTCSGNCTFERFIGGTRASTMGGMEIKVTANSAASQSGEDGGLDSSASCQSGGSFFRDSGYNLTNSTSYSNAAFSFGAGVYTALMSVGHWLCGNSTHYPLMPDNSKDALVVDVNISIPTTAVGTGVRSSLTLTFNATAEG